MAIMRTINLHSFTMLAKQKEGNRPWDGPRLLVSVIGGSLVRFKVHLNDRGENDRDGYGGTFSVQLIANTLTAIQNHIKKDESFEITLTQTRWSAQKKVEVEASLVLVRNDAKQCFLKLDAEDGKEVLFPYNIMQNASIKVNNKPIPTELVSSACCLSWWTRLSKGCDAANIVLLAMDARSFGGETDVGASSTPAKNDDYSSDVTF